MTAGATAAAAATADAAEPTSRAAVAPAGQPAAVPMDTEAMPEMLAPGTLSLVDPYNATVCTEH